MPLSRIDLEKYVKDLLTKYHAESAILFGSYARGEETADSDIDIVVIGGDSFRARDIFAFGEELRDLSQKNADVYEIREINRNTGFYDTIMKEGVYIA